MERAAHPGPCQAETRSPRSRGVPESTRLQPTEREWPQPREATGLRGEQDVDAGTMTDLAPHSPSPPEPILFQG